MQSKKYHFLIAMFMLISLSTYAQKSTSGYDVYDSTVIPSKRQPQQNEFWNNAYNFPAKPRDMWEVGISGGLFNISGDVSSVLPTFGFSAHVRKSLGYVFSLRLQYLAGTAKGLNWGAASNFSHNPAFSQYYSAPIGIGSGQTTIPGRAPQVVYYNYKNKTQDLSLQGLISLNNIRFHKNTNSFVFYGGGGFGATAYETMVNARNEAEGKDYSDLFTNTYNNLEYKYSNRRDILKALKNGMDNTYEEAAETQGERRASLGNQTLRFSASVIAGVEFKIGKRINLALEDRHTFIHDDLLDGQQWQEHPLGEPVLSPNWDSYNYLSVGLNYNLGKNSVEPLWWINPLDYVYGELNNPRHTKFPKPVLDDTDGDGVADQFDREPNTPSGSQVDTHGVSRDSDGDGVPDYKDKQLITPTECQPVDADGVGKCPDPECCKNIKPGSGGASGGVSGDCPTDYPSLSYKGNVATLTSANKAMLAAVAAKMKANPNCSITINGYPETSKAAQAVCQQRVDAVKLYLIQKEGISADRINTNCEVGGGDKNTVDIKSN